VNIEYPVFGNDVVDNSGVMNAEDLLDIITIHIIGEVIYVDDFDNVLEGLIRVGQRVTGSYTYNAMTPDSDPDPCCGVYTHTSPPYGILITNGALLFSTDPNNVLFEIYIVNEYFPGEDRYGLMSYNNLPLRTGANVCSIVWSLYDYTGTAFSSDALPSTPPNLADFGDTIMHLYIYGGIIPPDDYYYFIRIVVTGAEISAPPVPPSMGGYDNRFAGPNFPIGFKMSAEDPDLHPIRYGIDWGDGAIDWTDYIESGTLVDVNHIYSQPGVYTVKAMAEDEFGLQSPWSDTKTVRVFTGGWVLDWFINFLFPQ
jgi:hypothetical protein